MLKKINSWIKIRNKNFKNFEKILKKFEGKFTIFNPITRISSFVLPFLMRDKKEKVRLENYLNSHGIETRPFIAGNLLRQPFLLNYNKKIFKNADKIEFNAFYIGNNQFVNTKRINKLDYLMKKFFSKKINNFF